MLPRKAIQQVFRKHLGNVRKHRHRGCPQSHGTTACLTGLQPSARGPLRDFVSTSHPSPSSLELVSSSLCSPHILFYLYFSLYQSLLSIPLFIPMPLSCLPAPFMPESFRAAQCPWRPQYCSCPVPMPGPHTESTVIKWMLD